jgi:hypothetical protein
LLHFGNSESFIIFGPGEAKGELKKRLAKGKLARRVAAVETVDKMTDRQIAAKVREYFLSRSVAQRPEIRPGKRRTSWQKPAQRSDVKSLSRWRVAACEDVSDSRVGMTRVKWVGRTSCGFSARQNE